MAKTQFDGVGRGRESGRVGRKVWGLSGEKGENGVCVIVTVWLAPRNRIKNTTEMDFVFFGLF